MKGEEGKEGKEGKGDLSGKKKHVQKGTISSAKKNEDREKLSEDVNISPSKTLQTEPPNTEEKDE